MANSGGGVIVYGVRESQRVATERIDVGELDEAYERSVRSAAITAISPPVFGLNVHRLGDEGKRAVVVEVPASIDGPHLVGGVAVAARDVVSYFAAVGCRFQGGVEGEHLIREADHADPCAAVAGHHVADDSYVVAARIGDPDAAGQLAEEPLGDGVGLVVARTPGVPPFCNECGPRGCVASIPGVARHQPARRDPSQ